MNKRFLVSVVAVMLTLGTAGATAAPNSPATITFALSSTGGIHPGCQLTITSTKDISNYSVNGVKTEGVTVKTVTINVANGDVITVKSGTSTATYTVTGCAAPHVPGGDDHDHDGDGHTDGQHDGEDHDGDGNHDLGDHH